MGAAVHFALLWLSPAWATDHQIAEGLKRGARMNVLTYGKPPRAGTTSVPLANPDVLSTRAYLDLSKGPFVIEGLRPESCAYWSASVFAENTDAVLVSSDQQSPDRKISLALRMTSQTVNEPVLSQAVLPSKTAVVLLRCIMRDRVDLRLYR